MFAELSLYALQLQSFLLQENNVRIHDSFQAVVSVHIWPSHGVPGAAIPHSLLAALPVWVRLAQLERYPVIPFSQLQAQRRMMWVPNVLLVAGFITGLCRLPSFLCRSS